MTQNISSLKVLDPSMVCDLASGGANSGNSLSVAYKKRIRRDKFKAQIYSRDETKTLQVTGDKRLFLDLGKRSLPYGHSDLCCSPPNRKKMCE